MADFETRVVLMEQFINFKSGKSYDLPFPVSRVIIGTGNSGHNVFVCMFKLIFMSVILPIDTFFTIRFIPRYISLNSRRNVYKDIKNVFKLIVYCHSSDSTITIPKFLPKLIKCEEHESKVYTPQMLEENFNVLFEFFQKKKNTVYEKEKFKTAVLLVPFSTFIGGNSRWLMNFIDACHEKYNVVDSIFEPSTSKDNECSICFELIDENSITIKTCAHSFHEACVCECIRRTSLNNLRCPLCRTELFKVPPSNEVSLQSIA